jgi:hypothetical protein
MTGNRSKTVRTIEIAELLGVSKQRAHQLAGEDRFPSLRWPKTASRARSARGRRSHGYHRGDVRSPSESDAPFCRGTSDTGRSQP